MRYGRLLVVPHAHSPEELDALALETTAQREAGRLEEARRGYARLVEGWGAIDDPTAQVRAAGADFWLARLALDDGDSDDGRRHLSSARGRAARAHERWGDGSSVLLQLDVAAVLARLAIEDGDEQAAMEELNEALTLAAAAGADPTGLEELDSAAGYVAALVVANGMLSSGVGLLEALGAHRAAEGRKAAAVYDRLGGLLAEQADYHGAYGAYRRGIDAIDDLTERDPSLLRAGLLNGAGFAADQLGEYALAAALYQQSLDIRSELLSPDDRDLLLSRYNVAEVRRVTGDDVERAAAELEAIASAQRKLARAADGALPRTLKNLALAQLTLERFDAAERSCLEGLEARPAPEMRAQLLMALGQARERQGRAADVHDALVQVASEIASRTGEDSEDHLFAQIALAHMLPDDQLTEAEAIFEAIAGKLEDAPDHRAQGLRLQALVNLAPIRWARGDFDGALEAFRVALPEVQELRAELWRVGSALSNRAREPYPVTPPLVRMVARHLTERDEARRLAFQAAMSGKRLQAEALVQQRELVLQGRSELIGIGALAARLRRAAAWARSDEHADLDSLASLETALAVQVPREALLGIVKRSNAESIAAALPDGSVLVEYAVMPAFHFERSQPEGSEPIGADRPWCVAFVLHAGDPGSLALIDLGDMEPIQAAVAELRDAITQTVPAGDAWRRHAQTVTELIWDPVAGDIPVGADLLIAPDGALCSVPFDALRGPDGQPLLRSRTVTMLATGRDAHRMETRANWRTNTPVVVAAPEFGEPWEPFGPLLGAILEGSTVADILGVDPIVGDGATRDAVLALSDPEVLHLATHGYYLVSDRPDDLSSRLATQLTETPLMASGMALAGANDPGDGDGPRVVTALDVLGMQLSGTDLVVLSACESGLGVEDAGEGLLGLARSFLLGGARSVVWSLWRIDDQLGAELIEDFYGRLLRGSERAAALRRAKLAAYEAHPERVDVWAGFTLQGDPGALLRFRFVPVPEEQIYDQPIEEHEPGMFILDTEGKPFAVGEADIGVGEPIRIANVNLRNFGDSSAAELLAKGNRAFEEQRIDAARKAYEEGLELATEDERPGQRLVTALLNARLAIVAGLAAEPEQCLSYGTTAVEILDDLGGHDEELAMALDNLAIAEFNCGDHQGALARLDEAVALKRTVFPEGHEQIQFTLDRIEEMRGLLGQ